METNKPGNKKLPDFDSLNDRVIAERRTSGPMLVIKTNLDPKNVTENNPYYQNGEMKNPKEFNEYFED